MEIEKQINIERAYQTDALSTFFCGVREMDLLIHKKQDGLKTYIEQRSCEFYQVTENDTIVALFVITRRTISINKEQEDSLELDFLAVKKEYQRKRIGTIIIEEIEKQARQNGYNFLTVGAFKNKRYSAIGFYEKLGFFINGKQEKNVIPMLKIIIQ